MQGPDAALPPPRLCGISPVTSTNNPVASFYSHAAKVHGYLAVLFRTANPEKLPASEPPRSAFRLLIVSCQLLRSWGAKALPPHSSDQFPVPVSCFAEMNKISDSDPFCNTLLNYCHLNLEYDQRTDPLCKTTRRYVVLGSDHPSRPHRQVSISCPTFKS